MIILRNYFLWTFMCWLSWIITIIIKYLYCFYSPFLLRSYTAGHFHPIDQFHLSKSLLQPAEAELWDVGPWIITRNILHITWAVAWCITFHFSSKGAKMQTGWKEAWNLPKIASKRLGHGSRKRSPWPFVRLQTLRRHERTQHGTFGLLFSFNWFDPSKDLQSLLFKCYFPLPKR